MSDTIPETNRIYNDNSDTKFVAFDRIYGIICVFLVLVQKNGSTYKGRIDKKSIKLSDGTLGHAHVTADNRWFDSCGMPISKPTNLITHK